MYDHSYKTDFQGNVITPDQVGNLSDFTDMSCKPQLIAQGGKI